MTGKRNRKRARLEALFGPEATPETLAAVAQARERAQVALANARTALSPRQKRWLSAFELTVRWDAGGRLDVERAAEHMDCDVETAKAALNEIRQVLVAAGVKLGGNS